MAMNMGVLKMKFEIFELLSSLNICMESDIIYLLTLNNLFSYYREGGHLDLAERLTHSQYELTDRLTFFVCGKRPGKSF